MVRPQYLLPVDCDGVIFSELVEEVGGVACGEELDTEVFYIKGESSG